MNDRIDDILAKLKSIEDSFEKSKPKWYERLFWIIEKALVPIMIALFAYYGNMAATKISEGQLILAKTNLDDRKAEFRRTMQGKYLEIFYRDMFSVDAKQQSAALGLLKLMDPELASDVAALVQASPQISKEIKAELRVETQRIEAAVQKPSLPKVTGVLAGYKIGIYYLSNDPAAVKTAQSIQSQLRQQGLADLVALYPSDQEFMIYANPPLALEVRYEQGIENRQAQLIVDALKKKPINRNANLVQVGSQTPNFLSIFVPSGG